MNVRRIAKPDARVAAGYREVLRMRQSYDARQEGEDERRRRHGKRKVPDDERKHLGELRSGRCPSPILACESSNDHIPRLIGAFIDGDGRSLVLYCLLQRSHAKQPLMCAFTYPHACKVECSVVGPTNLKPRFRRNFESSTDSSVFVGS